MNTTPESVPKYEDTEEGDHSKESQSPKTENQREEARGINGTTLPSIQRMKGGTRTLGWTESR